MNNSQTVDPASSGVPASGSLPPLPPLPDIMQNAPVTSNDTMANNASTPVPAMDSTSVTPLSPTIENEVQPVMQNAVVQSVESLPAVETQAPEPQTIDSKVQELTITPQLNSETVKQVEEKKERLDGLVKESEPKKKDVFNLLIVFLTILLIVLLGVVGYLVYQLINLPEKTTDQNTNNNTTSYVTSYPVSY